MAQGCTSEGGSTRAEEIAMRRSFAIIVCLGGLLSAGWLNQESTYPVANTNTSAIISNNVSESGYFRQIAIKIPAGLTNECVIWVDQFTGSTLLQTNNIGAATNAAKTILLWQTNLMHGAYWQVTSNCVAVSTNTISVMTNTVNALEDR
jgi:hypothetical protein